MAERTSLKDSFTVLLVDGTEAEVMRLRKDMPGWLWIEAPKGWPFAKEAAPIAQSFQAILVFAHKNKETRALEVCKHICEEKTMGGATLLVAASRYQMALVNAVKRLPRGHFIFMPIGKDAMLERISETKRAKD